MFISRLLPRWAATLRLSLPVLFLLLTAVRAPLCGMTQEMGPVPPPLSLPEVSLPGEQFPSDSLTARFDLLRPDFVQEQTHAILQGKQFSGRLFYTPTDSYAQDEERLQALIRAYRRPYSVYSAPADSALLFYLQRPLVVPRAELSPFHLKKDFNPLRPLAQEGKNRLFWDQPSCSVPSLRRNAIGRQWHFEQETLERLARRDLSLFTYGAGQLEPYRIDFSPTAAADNHIAEPHAATDSLSGLFGKGSFQWIGVDRRYWFPKWRSIVQISQNYISPNWHKGGLSNLTLSSKQLFNYDYRSDKTLWINEAEWRLSVNARPDEERNFSYRVSEDLFRLHSNLGHKALKNWFYSCDVEAKTQFFANYSEDNSVLYSHLLSPLTATVGLGMKYVLDKKYPRPFGRRLRLDINLSPLAYELKWTRRQDIDLARHGFAPGKRLYNAVGSMLRAKMIWDINAAIAWESSFYYNTSYKRIETELENTLSFAFNRYFSARINVVLRYDDAAPPAAGMRTKLQTFELLSIGFDYTL